MTRRLYYEDAYIKAFEASVLQVREGNIARLDASAFYPTGGGQPHDEGSIGGARVLDVFADDAGEVWHALDAPISAGAKVSCEIDWARRFDHMQQHAGEHMLANALYRMFDGFTIGLHLGKDVSTIDVELPGGKTRLSDADISALEDDVNARIQADLPIRCFFPEPGELARLKLRKPPAVSEGVRVVMIGEDELCACGGTHPSGSGQVGLLKIADARPSKGKLRVSFLCGKRALNNYARCASVIKQLTAALSTGLENIPAAVDALAERARNAEYNMAQAYRKLALSNIDGLKATARGAGKARVVVAEYPEMGMDALREVAGEIIKSPGYAALLAARAPEAGYMLVFARAVDLKPDMGALMRGLGEQFGVKGGGRPDFAQGAAASAEALEAAFTKIQCAFDI